jgi:hypothetical protein
MDKERFEKMVQDFFEALRQKTLLVIIDSASKNDKAVFSLVSFKDSEYIVYSPMLKELGFRKFRKEEDLFVTYCAGRFRLYILDNIGTELRHKGVELPDDYFNIIQSQNAI